MNQPPLRQRSGFHISLKWLLLSVVPISCAAAALRSATTAWAVAAVSFTLLAMFGSIIAAKFDVRRRRPIWLGFAVFAGGYLVVLFGAPRDIVEAFGTEKLNRLLIASCHPAVDYPVEQMILMRTAPADERPARVAKSAIYMALFGLLDDQPATSDSTNSTAAAADTAADTDRSANDVFSGNAIAPNGPTPTNPFADEDRKRATAENFKEIARCAWAWIFGLCGACLANCLAIRHATTSIDSGIAPAELVDPSTKRSRARTVGAAIVFAGEIAAGGLAIWRAHPAWLLIVISVVVFGSLGAAISALFGDRRRAAFRAGFAISCGGYFLIGAFAARVSEDGIRAYSFYQSSVMEKSLDWAWASGIPTQDIPIHLPIQGVDQSGMGVLGVPVGATSSEKNDVDSASADRAAARPINADLQAQRWPIFWQTWHCLWALAIGWMGGGLAQFLARRRSQSSTTDSRTAIYKTKGASDVFD